MRFTASLRKDETAKTVRPTGVPEKGPGRQPVGYPYLDYVHYYTYLCPNTILSILGGVGGGVSPSLHSRLPEKFGRLQPEGACNSCDVYKRNILLSALNLPDISSVQIADLCEVLLRQVQARPFGANRGAE